jgi:hypothetical protein
VVLEMVATVEDMATIKNEYYFKDNYCELVMTTPKMGRVTAIVSIEDIEKIRAIHWRPVSYGGRVYAVGKDRPLISLHRFLLDNPVSYVDHINNNSLDNRRENLRLATPSQNAMNKKMRSDNRTGFPGVRFVWRQNRYHARIGVGGKRISLGYFKTAEEAHDAYKSASLKYHGEFSPFAKVA